MDGLIVKAPWINLELKGLKTWEIRGCDTHKRGRICLLESGTCRAGGEITLCDSIELTEELWNKNLGNHHVALTWKELIQRYKHPYAWVLENPEPYEENLTYEHPQGAAIWVKDVRINKK